MKKIRRRAWTLLLAAVVAAAMLAPAGAAFAATVPVSGNTSPLAPANVALFDTATGTMDASADSYYFRFQTPVAGTVTFAVQTTTALTWAVYDASNTAVTPPAAAGPTQTAALPAGIYTLELTKTPGAAGTYSLTITMPSVKVTWNPAGGKVSPKTSAVVKGAALGAQPTPTKKGYRFTGWYTAKRGGTKVKSTTKVLLAKTTKLYAHWTKLR